MGVGPGGWVKQYNSIQCTRKHVQQVPATSRHTNINADTYTCQCPNSHAHATMHNIDSANDTSAHYPTNVCKCVYYATSDAVAQIVGVSQHNSPHLSTTERRDL